jgi:dihydrofolate reductase
MNIKCSVFIATSLDGFIARKDGAIDWLVSDQWASGDEDYGYKTFFAGIDTLVIGRKSYELVLGFPEWPYTGKKVVVLSTGTPSIPATLAAEVTVLSGTPAAIVQRLAERGTRHLYVDGGQTIQGFLRAGLIHELTITQIPILLGEGIPLFGPLDHDLRLEHLHTQAYANGFVQSKYQIR